MREVPVEGLVGVQVVDIQKSMWGVNYMNDKIRVVDGISRSLS